MCYVIGIKIPKKETIKIGDKTVDLDPIDIPVQSGFSYQPWPVIYNETQTQKQTQTNTHNPNQILNSQLRPGLMHWELIPTWVRNNKELVESRKKYTTLNIKSEGILTNKVSQAVIHTNRCLVLASHFFEWQEIQKEKFPHCIQVSTTPLFYMAGVWNSWTDFSTGETINSFGIITTEANELMSKIHNVKKRMPTILNETLADQWVNKSLSTHEIVEMAQHQFDAKDMSAYTIAKNFQQINNPLEKVDYKIFTPQSLF